MYTTPLLARGTPTLVGCLSMYSTQLVPHTIPPPQSVASQCLEPNCGCSAVPCPSRLVLNEQDPVAAVAWYPQPNRLALDAQDPVAAIAW